METNRSRDIQVRICNVLRRVLEFHQIGRRGDVCRAFPDLTESSTPDDIKRSASDVFVRIHTIWAKQHPEASAEDESDVRQAATLLFEVYADAYVNGLKERQT